MPDIRDRVEQDRGLLKKIQLVIPGYAGYRRREDIRAADNLLRIQLANQLKGVRGDLETIRDQMAMDGKIQGLQGIGNIIFTVEGLEAKVQGRLVFVDYASAETHLRSETPLPPSLSWLVDEAYRGPLVFRIDPAEERPLPRRADLLVPIFPQREAARPDRQPLWRLIGVTATPGDELVFLSSVGEVLKLGADGVLRLVVRLPAGHYHRTNLTTGPDGSVFVCAGYQIRQIFRISPTGGVSVVASELGDPGACVLDANGALYVPETAL